VAIAILSALPPAGVDAEGLFFPPQEKWNTTLESPPSFPAAFDETHVYVARRDNQLMALSLETGKLAWSVECPMTAPPVAGDASVFSGRDGRVEARARHSRGRW
jgi:outer membrane protein assembly factor BamB